MATRQCAVCGKPFEAARSTAKYCGSSCRARASQGAGAARPVGPPAGLNADRSDRGLVQSTQAALVEAGVLQTVAGQQAMLLAHRMTSPSETGAAVASMSKQLSAVMVEALKSVKRVDPLDELRQRRDTKRAAG